MDTTVFFGTYTRDSDSRGIYRTTFDDRTGALGRPVLAAEAANPTFLALHPKQPMLYSVDADRASGDPRHGAISAFAITPRGGLVFAGQCATTTLPPCHLVAAPAGGHVLFASYHDGRAGVVALDEDGLPDRVTASIRHAGSGPNPDRQDAPHAHSINLSPDQRFALVADLGIDRIVVYRFNSRDGTLEAHDPTGLAAHPGAGPRHLAFHPNGRFAYLVNELDATIIALAYDAASGALETLQTVPGLPSDFSGENTAAEIAVHPEGTYVYASNRGHDSLVCYTVDPAGGRLSDPAWTPSGGRGPRHFAIHSSGRWLLAANQVDGTVGSFALEPSTGRLAPAGATIRVPQAVCVRFAG